MSKDLDMIEKLNEIVTLPRAKHMSQLSSDEAKNSFCQKWIINKFGCNIDNFNMWVNELKRRLEFLPIAMKCEKELHEELSELIGHEVCIGEDDNGIQSVEIFVSGKSIVISWESMDLHVEIQEKKEKIITPFNPSYQDVLGKDPHHITHSGISTKI